MEFCVSGDDLRRALADIEAAEEHGFNYCLAVFKLAQAGPTLSDVRAEYSDLFERAHPTDPSLDWGRFQSVTQRNRFVNGQLCPLASSVVKRNEVR